MRPSHIGRVNILAGLLTCGSGLGWTFPPFWGSGLCQLRSPLTVAGAVVDWAQEPHHIPYSPADAGPEWRSPITTPSFASSTQIRD